MDSMGTQKIMKNSGLQKLLQNPETEILTKRGSKWKRLTDVHKYGRFTDVHKYENDPLAVGLLTYISAYALMQKTTENPTNSFWPTASGSKWTSGPFFNPGISDDGWLRFCVCTYVCKDLWTPPWGPKKPPDHENSENDHQSIKSRGFCNSFWRPEFSGFLGSTGGSPGGAHRYIST